jgi:hypothetical protein
MPPSTAMAAKIAGSLTEASPESRPRSSVANYVNIAPNRRQ